MLHTDAAGPSPTSLGGWGAWYCCGSQRLIAQGPWTALGVSWSSTGLELQAVLNAFLAFNRLGVFDGTLVQVHTDAQNVWYSLMKGSSFALDCVALAQSICLYLFQHNIRLDVVWIPREKNKFADSLSKRIDRTDWQLSPDVFAWLSSLWGPFSVDLFSTARTAQLPYFYSKYWTPTCSGVNALTQHWPSVAWAYPPVRLIPAVLACAAGQQARLCLIVPHHSSCSWWFTLAPDTLFFSPVVLACRPIPMGPDLFRIHAWPCSPPCPLLALLLDFGSPSAYRIRVPTCSV
jgi:hypothetical protein